MRIPAYLESEVLEAGIWFDGQPSTDIRRAVLRGAEHLGFRIGFDVRKKDGTTGFAHFIRQQVGIRRQDHSAMFPDMLSAETVCLSGNQAD